MKSLVTFCWILCLVFLCSDVARSAPLVALMASNKLQRIETTAPGFIQGQTTITGLQPGENLLVIDFRPSTGQLYGVTDLSRLYVISLATGAATQVGSGSFSPALELGGFRGFGVDLGFDFDPVTDRIRVVTVTGQNLRLNPDTGSVENVDTTLAFASGDQNDGRAPAVTSAAYSNNFAGATSSTLYTIINGNGSGFPPTVLATQGSPGGSPVSANSGQLFTVGTVGLVYIQPSGLDIAPDGTAYALINSTDTLNQFFTINLATGTISHIGGTGPEFVRDIAIALPNSGPPAGTFQFDAASLSVNEDGTSITVNVTRTGDTTVAAAVDLTTVDDSAKQRSDYIIALRKLEFGPGETSKSVKILIVDDVFVDPSETFDVFLSNATQGFLPGRPNPVAVTIIDNDFLTILPVPNPLEDAQFFVRQQYFDFLNREPDPAGFNFWVNQITSCISQQCTEIRRTNVSAAFFLSIEFQRTGLTAFLTHRLANEGFFPRYREFMRDVQALQKDLVFGAPGADAQLEANKRAFFDDFVARPEFVFNFGGYSNAQYVDFLLEVRNVGFTQAERDALVSGLNAGTETRATVLRKIVENDAFAQSQRNTAFVLMEYFAYLRRNPNDPPDNNFAGFTFWLNKLNSFNGDFVASEMVKAFIRSTEYRSRFGFL
jgi:uncharacterized protein DUF4394/Calx-beta domain-containing protein/uncharacterized protein DUF4214